MCAQMTHLSALYRPKHPHISPPFLSRPCLQQAVRQNTFAKSISNANYGPWEPDIAGRHVLILRNYAVTLQLEKYTHHRAWEKMLSGVKDIIAAYRHGCNERNCAYSNNRRHPISTPTTNTNIKTYEPAMLTDVASSFSQGPSRNATKQLRSLEQRATPQLPENHSDSQYTRSICYQVPIVIATVYHCIARPSNCALSNDERHAATSASPMTVTHLPIYKSGKLSNAASSLSHRPSRSATKQLRPLEQRATPRLPERSHDIYFA